MSPDQTIHPSVNEQGICKIEMDCPGKAVNLLSSKVLSELSDAVDAIQSNPKIKGVIFLSRKPNHFIGGALIDVKQFLEKPQSALDFVEEGRLVFQKIHSLSVPTLAAINGTCLGGGLELALACRYRLATDHRKTRIGLPEVLLGILPAWGGTTRLPRMLGLTASLDLLLTGKQLDARRALRVGLIDRMITSHAIPLQAEAFLNTILTKRQSIIPVIKKSRQRPQSRLITRLLDRTRLGRWLVFRQARKNVLKLTHGKYPAPLKIIEVVRKGIKQSMENALPLEQKAIEVLIRDLTTANLLHVFSLRMQAGKLPEGVTVSDSPPEIKKVGVIGAGAMGAGIAQWLIQHEIPVRLRDINEDQVAKGIATINQLLEKQVSRRKLRPEEKAHYLDILSPTTDYSGFSDCDFVIEAVAEKIEIKEKVIRELQAKTSGREIFASNTSSLSVSTMSQAALNHEKVLGLHFFNPVSKMPLVEVVRAKKTSNSVLAAGVAFVKRIGKTPVITSDSPGFLVNRILMAYANEAGLLLEDGANVDAVDRAMLAFGMPMGPFTMMDVVGLDIAWHAGSSISTALKLDLSQQAKVVYHLFEAGRLGRKTGSGFYQYKKGKPVVDHRGLEAPLAQARNDRGISTRSGIGKEEISNRLILIMINTAAWCLENKVVETPGDVDLGMIMGTGFPPFRGGLLVYADKMGLVEINQELNRCAQTLGDRFKPSALIQTLAQKNSGFYSS